MSDKLAERVQFTRDTSGERQNLFKSSLASRTNTQRKPQEHEKKYYAEHEITASENQRLRAYSEVARARLKSLGLSHADTLIPNSDQIIIFDAITSNEIGGHTDTYGDYLRIDKPKWMGIDTQSFQKTYYHEASHFAGSRVLRIPEAENDNPQLVAFGFNRTDQTNNWKAKGINSEPLAELFSLYCVGENQVIETPYSLQVPFYIGLIQSYADHSDKTFLATFADFYKANAERDFSFQKKLVDIYGTEFVKDFNNIVTSGFMGVLSRGSLLQLAEKGGFLPNYMALQEQIDNQIIIPIPDLDGGIKRRDPAMES